jgi:myo-inositol catabolism protein IolC
LSINAIDAVGIFPDDWKLEQEQDEFWQLIKKQPQEKL